MADGVHQVRLAKSGASVEKKGIVCVAGGFRDSQAGRVGEHIVAAYDESIEPVFGMKMGILYFGSAGSLDRRRLFFRGVIFIVQNESDVILLSDQFRDGDLEEVAVILGDIGQLELVVGGNADNDLIAPDICDFQIFDPGLVGNIGQLIGIAYMFLDVLPALFDDLVVHITPLVGKTAPAR